MREIKFKIVIDDDRIREELYSKYLLVMRTVAPIVYVIILVLIRVVSPSTHRQISKRTQPRNAVYTAEKRVFTPQSERNFEVKKERVGAENSEPNMHSSTLVKCLNPDCKNPPFPYEKRGNQAKKFCSGHCKDAYHNSKKMKNYYQYENK